MQQLKLNPKLMPLSNKTRRRLKKLNQSQRLRKKKRKRRSINLRTRRNRNKTMLNLP